MKIILIVALSVFSLALKKCNKENTTANCYKGRLEIKGICSNYTIKVVDGKMPNGIVATWSDESSGKTHSNVFALGNPCSFPSTINEGQEFYFTIDNAPSQDCITCQAYYPKPPKALSIKVLNGPCQ